MRESISMYTDRLARAGAISIALVALLLAAGCGNSKPTDQASDRAPNEAATTTDPPSSEASPSPANAKASGTEAAEAPGAPVEEAKVAKNAAEPAKAKKPKLPPPAPGMPQIEQPEPVNNTILRVWHPYTGAEATAVRKFVEAYQAENPKPEISIEPLDRKTFADRVAIDIPNGRGPDLFIHSHDALDRWASRKLIEPLAGQVTPDLLGELAPNAIMALNANGAIQGVPLSLETLALYYRQDWVDAPPKSLTDLAGLKAKLKKSHQIEHPLAFDARRLFYHAPILWGFGGGWFNAGGTFDLDSAAAVQATGFVKDVLIGKGIISDPVGPGGTGAVFGGGKAAFAIDGPWLRNSLPQNAKVGIVPIPSLDGERKAKPLLVVDGAFVSAKSNWKKESFALATALADVEGAVLRAVEGGQIPTHRRAYADKRLESADDLKAFWAASKDAVPLPVDERVSSLWTPYDSALQATYSGRQKAAEALAAAERQVSGTKSDSETP